MEWSNEQIWEAIANSAKKRFDYTSFYANFPFVDNKIILKLIIGLASRKDKDILAEQLHEEVKNTSGEDWKMDQIKTFLADKDEVFKREIFAAGRFGNMLYEGAEQEEMYDEVSKYILTN